MERKTVEIYEYNHPSKLIKGDILFCNYTKNTKIIHCAMYIGNKLFIESIKYLGVRIAHAWGRPLFWDEFGYGYVKQVYQLGEELRNKIIDRAIRFALLRLKRPYNLTQVANYNPYDSTDPNSNKWYCSELVWAAYVNASIAVLNKMINISNAPHIKGSKYEWVHVRSLINSNEIQFFSPNNSPIPSQI